MEKITRQPPPGITRRTWHELLDQMIELEAAGALSGIRAVVAERLTMVRAGVPLPDEPMEDLRIDLVPGDNGRIGTPQLASAAAWLAANIDQPGKL